MKYWIFQNNEVCGPHDDDDLAQLPGYSAETLVCPEGRKGTRMGDWQRAGMVPALSLSLVKAAQLTTAGKSAGPANAVYGGLPPEPTLKDLAALGSLQEKMALMESSIAQFQEGMQSKETELLSLHREIDVRKGIEADLQSKIGELEQRLSAVAQLRETIDTAVAAEKSVESEVKGVEDAVHGFESTVQEVRTSITGVNSTVKGLESSLEKQGQTVSDLMGEIERLKSQRAAAPALPAIQPPLAPPLTLGAPAPALQSGPGAEPPPLVEGFPEPAPLAPPPPAPMSFDAPAAPAALSAPPAPFHLDAPPPAPLFAGQPSAPALAPSFGGASAGIGPKSDFPKGGSPFSAPAPSVPPLSAPSLLPSLGPSAATPGASGIGPKPVPADAAGGPAKTKSKKGLVMALVCFALIAGGGLAFQAGLIPGLKRPARRANPAAATPVPPPVAAAAAAPSAEAQAEELKHQAIDLVKNWPSSDKTTLVSQRLEPAAADGSNPALSWMAEKLGEGSFQVNFYGGKSANGKQSVYMFQANLADKTVAPYNDDAAAKAILFGEAPAAKGKVRVKAKRPAAAGQDQSASGLPVIGGEEAGGQPAASSADAAAAAPDQTKKPARKAPRRQAGEDKKPAKPADDAQLLDQLLD
jgi:hypothetical protein